MLTKKIIRPLAIRPKFRYWHLLTLVILLSGLLFIYFDFWLPNKRLSNIDALIAPTPQEIRELCHQVLKYPFGNHHDAFIMLEGYGNTESIPILINALKWQRETKADERMICTKSHCLEALQKLTGEDFGNNYDDWSHLLKSYMPGQQ